MAIQHSNETLVGPTSLAKKSFGKLADVATRPRLQLAVAQTPCGENNEAKNKATGSPGGGLMKESYTTLAQEENPEGPEEQDEEERKKITQIRLKSNPTVSRCKRCFLAVVRAIIFVSATSALLYLQVWWATEYAWYETPLNVTGTLNHTSVLSSIEENCLVDESVVDLWAKDLSKERSLIVEVHPDSPSPLPVMTWYVSEEVYRNRDGWIPLLSFSARLAKPARVELVVEQDLNESEYLKLLEDAFRRYNFLVEEEDLIWTGNYLVGHRHTSHQGMLWNSIEGWQYYRPSKEWQFLTAVAFVIMMVSCSTILKFLIREAETDWSEACQVWITQHDYLWQAAKAKEKGKTPIKPDTKKISEKANPEKAPFKYFSRARDEEKGEASGAEASRKKKVLPLDPVEPVEVDVNWDERLCMCSPFFVLDNTLANAYTCEEQVFWAVASSVVHSLTFSICPALPCVACHFMKDWVPIFHFFMGAYGLAVIPLGLSYYFTLNHGKLNLTFALLQIFVMTCWVVASIVYIISSLIYLAAIASIDSQLIVDALVPLATVFAYASIVISRLKALQAHYIAAAEGKATKGFLMYETHRLGFSTAGIIVLAIEGVASLFGLFLVQLAVRNMYAGSVLVQNNLIQAAVLPSYALINAMLNLKNEKLHDARGEIQEDLVNTIKEIF
eukprot:s454_g11.t1